MAEARETHPSKIETDFTSNVEALNKAVNFIQLGNGGDWMKNLFILVLRRG